MAQSKQQVNKMVSSQYIHAVGSQLSFSLKLRNETHTLEGDIDNGLHMTHLMTCGKILSFHITILFNIYGL